MKEAESKVADKVVTEEAQSTTDGPEEPPFNPDDYSSFSDDERNEDSIAEQYQSVVSTQASEEAVQPSAKSSPEQTADTSSGDEHAALASLHSALGLSFSDESEVAQVNESKVEQAPQADTPKQTQATEQKAQPENDDEFKLEPFQPESARPESEVQQQLEPVEAAKTYSGTHLEQNGLDENDFEENDPPATEEARQWAQHVKNMDLTGSYQQIAQCSTVQWLSDDKIQLTVEPAQDILCTDTAKQAIEESLADYFDKKLQVDWQFGEAQVATPAMIWQRAAKAKHRKACETITQHPFAQQIAQKFGAQLDKNSIQYLDA